MSVRCDVCALRSCSATQRRWWCHIGIGGPKHDSDGELRVSALVRKGVKLPVNQGCTLGCQHHSDSSCSPLTAPWVSNAFTCHPPPYWNAHTAVNAGEETNITGLLTPGAQSWAASGLRGGSGSPAPLSVSFRPGCLEVW